MNIRPIYSLKEKFTNDYHKNSDMEWMIVGAIILAIVITFITGIGVRASNDEPITEDYSMSLPDYPMEFGTVLQASQTEMAEIYRRAKAISICEGYGKAGSLAQRNNNPGNLKTRGVHDSQGHTIYPTKVAGWQALYNLLYKHRTKSIYQLSRFYASASNTWYRCVSSKF